MSQKRTKSKHFDSKQRFSSSHYHHYYFDCDPWLSRAAREILHQHLSNWWLSQSKNDRNYQQKEPKSNVWEYLDALLLSNTTTLTFRNSTTYKNTSSTHPLFEQCPLFGIDLLRQQEENSLQIPSQQISIVSALPYTTIEENNNNNHENHQYWYQCNLCQKTFLTRFYLDRHMYNYHQDLLDIPIDQQQEQERRSICPAQHWCHFLIDCYDVAVTMEPYYSPGSGGWSNYDRQKVTTMVRKRIPSCHEIHLQETIQECRNMVMTCFAHNIPLQEYLLKHLCPSQTCYDRLHRIILQSTGLVLSSSSLLTTTNNHAINWKVEKMKQTITNDWIWGQHGVIGFVLLLLFLLLLGLFGYLCSGKFTTIRHNVVETKPPSRLLQKPRHGVSKRKRYFGNNPKEKQS